MKDQTVRRIIASIALLMFTLSLLGSAALTAGKKARPTVVLIHSNTCGACKKLGPTMAELTEIYKDRINFVTLNVTNEENVAASTEAARQLGIGEFFEAHKRKTSTVAIFSPKGELLFQTVKNFDREVYVKAFDEAIAKVRG
jgi:thiol-disulfide isomerase/thioredoxin